MTDPSTPPAGSRLLLPTVLLAWTLGLLVSPLVISPGTDDGFYALMPIGFFAEHSIGTFHLREFDQVFYVLPGYYFLQSLFYYPLLLAGMDYNFITAKLHQLVACAALVAVTAVLVTRLCEPAMSRLRAGLALAALGMTPFVQDAMNIRPEPAGLLATAVALAAFHRGMAGTAGGRLWFATAAFALGLAATMHPTFIVTSGGVGLMAIVLVAHRRGWRSTLLPIAAGCLPPLIMVLWYLANLPQSWIALSANAELRAGGWHNPLIGLIDIVEVAFMLRGGGLSLAQLNQVLLYQAMFWSTLLAVGFAFHAWRSAATPARRDTILLLAVMLAMALVNIMINASTRLQFHVVLSYPAVVLAAIGVPLGWLAGWITRSRLLHAGLAAVCVLVVLFAPMAHVLKHVAPGTRYHPLSLAAAVEPALKDAARLYLSDDRFVLAFADRIQATLEGSGNPDTYWALPYVVGDRVRENRTLSVLLCEFRAAGDAPVVWVISENRIDTVNEDEGRAVILSRVYAGSRALEYSMRFDKVLYRAHDFLALHGRIEAVQERLADGTRRTLYRPPQVLPTCPPA